MDFASGNDPVSLDDRPDTCSAVPGASLRHRRRLNRSRARPARWRLKAARRRG